MAQIIDDKWSRPTVRFHMAKRSVDAAIDMLCDDTLPSSVATLLEPLKIVRQILADMEYESRRK